MNTLIKMVREREKEFEENYLDGDKIQDGQFLSSKECFNITTSTLISFVKEEIKMVKSQIQELPKTKCMNAENHLFGSCFACEKIKGRNEGLDDIISTLEEILKDLTKDI